MELLQQRILPDNGLHVLRQIADGLFKIQIAVDAKRFGIQAWWLILVLAALAGGVGLMS